MVGKIHPTAAILKMITSLKVAGVKWKVKNYLILTYNCKIASCNFLFAFSQFTHQ